jgi:thioredoxin 1
MAYIDTNIVLETIATTEGVVLLEFSAEWCPPCRMLEPIVERLAAEAPDLTVLRIDVDAAPELARSYDVMSFPTLMFFVGGELRRRVVGARGIGPLREELEQLRVPVGPA